MLSRSRVERASRSRRVTISVSPAPSTLSAFASSLRSLFMPLAVSWNTFAAQRRQVPLAVHRESGRLLRRGHSHKWSCPNYNRNALLYANIFRIPESRRFRWFSDLCKTCDFWIKQTSLNKIWRANLILLINLIFIFFFFNSSFCFFFFIFFFPFF